MIDPGRFAHDALSRVRDWFTGPSPMDLKGLPPLARWDDSLRRTLPYVFAVSTGLQITRYVIDPTWVAFDALLYTAAAREWLAGGIPWEVSSWGIPFGAPPPTLLALVPFTILADPIVAVSWVVGSFILAALAIRALGLPMWWMAFWPIVDGALVGNPNIAILALLVILGRRLDFLAPILKVYAVFPLVAERRWRSIGVFAVVMLLSAFVLPWASWLVEFTSITESLRDHAGTTSVWGEPVLMVIGLIALASLGVRRAGWLVVPVLWPFTQLHYMAMSVPALTPMLAIAWSVPQPPPILVLGSVVVAAIGARRFPAAEPVETGDSGGAGPSRTAADQSNVGGVRLNPQEGS